VRKYVVLMRNNLSIIFLLAFATNLSLAQCPNNAVIKANGNCFTFTYTTPPSMIPASIIYNSNTYTYQSGTTYNYKTGSGNTCNASDNPFTGTLQVGSDVCVFNNSILPIQFAALEIESKPGRVKIAWEVEKNSDAVRFDLQKSANAEEWSTISSINADPNVFNFVYYDHLNSKSNTIYYRLLGVSQDETITFSPIKSITSSTILPESFVFPNPSDHFFQVVLDASFDPLKTTIIISDVSGKEVWRSAYSQDQIATGNLKPGTYFISLKQEDKLQSTAFIKN